MVQQRKIEQIQRQTADPAPHLQGSLMELGEMFPTKGPAQGQKLENMVLVPKSRGKA